MTPLYMNSQPQSSIPFIDLNKDNNNHQQKFQVFGYLYGGDHNLSTSTNNSSFSYNPNNTLNSSEIFSFDYTRRDHQVKVEKMSDLDQQRSSWIQNRVGDQDNRSSNNYTYSMNMEEKNQNNGSANNPNNNNENKYSRKWNKSSKVRIKMTTNSKNSRERSKQEDDHDDIPKRQINNDGIRVCTDCHTTTTPLWRSGPQGPKSLCNACGIRQRKARRAAMAAATTSTGFNKDATVTSMSHVEAPKPKVQVIKSEKGLDHGNKNHTLPLKKRSKIINATNKNYNNNNSNNNNYYTHNNSKKICFEDLALNPNKDNSMRSFPRDEEEGAILLMALSCGLACYSY